MSADLFEIGNARNLTIEQLVKTFVPTKTFWNLLSGKNHIVQGSRGSGKTALAKMLSHPHLSKFEDEKAKEIIQEKRFIGIYVPMSTEWLGSLKNKSKINLENEEFLFQWKLNIKTCLSFLDTFQSCLICYAGDEKERLLSEIEFVEKVSEFWVSGSLERNTIESLKKYMTWIEFKKQINTSKKDILNEESVQNYGSEFDIALFNPLNYAIKIASEILNLTDETSWLLCLDEAEILTENQQRIINSYLRSFSNKLFFKIITMPYQHLTRETNLGANLSLGNDFEYAYIDKESPFVYMEQTTEVPKPIQDIFNKRIEASGGKYDGITLDQLLGKSILLDKQKWDFNPKSKDMQLLFQYSSKITLDRAKKLLQEEDHIQFANQIARKMKSLLLLKNSVAQLRGRKLLDVYSGTKTIVRCCDANPRTLIRLFKEMLSAIPKDVNNLKTPLISPIKQTQIMIKFSKSFLERVQSEDRVGFEVYDTMIVLGKFMEKSIHSKKIDTEQIASIDIPRDISDHLWLIITKAVENCLLYPSTKESDPDLLPNKNGTFRLAYILSPYFNLLPRKGTSRSLYNMLRNQDDSQSDNIQQSLLF